MRRSCARSPTPSRVGVGGEGHGAERAGGLRVHRDQRRRPRRRFSLDDDADAALSNTQLLTGLVDGQTYVVTETTANAAGFSLTDLVCTGGGADTTVDIPGGVATIGFDAGEDIVCTFTNTQQGSVSVVKDTVPNGPADFAFTATDGGDPGGLHPR